MAPMFEYKALTPDGKSKRDLVEAENAKAARQKVKKLGLMVTEIAERTASNQSAKRSVPFSGGGKVGIRDISLMTRQLASLVKAKIPLVEALNALVDQIENERLKVVVAQVRQDVNEGSSLAKACGAHPKVFDNIYVNMIEAGESSGTLGLVLLRLADLKEAQLRLRGKITSAMMYPSLMMGVASFLMIAIFVGVIPKMAKLFDSMNKPMPPTTKFLLVFSDIVVTYWPIIIVAVFIVIITFRKWTTSASGKPVWDAFKLRVPVIGPLVRMIAVTRFSSTMSTLMASGVPILTCMKIARNLVGSAPIEAAVAAAQENITEGQTIADPLRKSGEFPPMMIHMIAIGEKTGDLPSMLKNVAETYEEQINSRIDGLTGLLEPMMIIGMGGAVGFIVISVMMPLMDITNLNQR